MGTADETATKVQTRGPQRKDADKGPRRARKDSLAGSKTLHHFGFHMREEPVPAEVPGLKILSKPTAEDEAKSDSDDAQDIN